MSIVSRDELLSRLKGITFAVFMTCLPTEMCLEIETMTAEGVGFQWIGYDDWQVFGLRKCDAAQWRSITKKISEKSLSEDDIASTDLGRLADSIAPLLDETPNWSVFLSDLCNLKPSDDGLFYGFFDGKEMRFFTSQNDLREALRTTFAIVKTKWEDLDIPSLEYWWDRYENEGNGLPLITFDDTE